MFTNHLKRLLPLCLSVLLWLVSAPAVNAADITSVSGTVTDELGDPIIGAVIKELNTKNTTITNIDGEFNMKLQSKNPVLEITYLGYTTVKVPVDKAKLEIAMQPQANDLEEVVVVAYGQQKKVTVTGSVASVGGAELKKSSEPNLTAALSGKLPGLTTIQKSAAPGEDDATMFLRGAATTNGTAPLILVDGIPRTSMSDIDPNEVATISVLKDASSTAVFGVRGANGVILITTKRGEEGKINVHGQVQYSMQKFASWPKSRHSYEYVNLVNEAALRDGLAEPIYSQEHVDIYDMWRNGKPTQARYRELYPDGRYRDMSDEHFQYFFPDNDWSDVYMKDHSDMVQANVNVSGGSKKLKYFVSAGYVYQGGMYKTESSQKLGYDPSARMNRYNIRVNLDYKFNDWISASLDLSSYIKKYDAPSSDTNDSFDSGSTDDQNMRLNTILGRPTDVGPLSIKGLYYQDPLDVSRLIPLDEGVVVHPPHLTNLQSGYALMNRSGQKMSVNSAVNGVGTLNIDLGKLTPGLSMRGVVAFETFAHSYTLSRKKWAAYTYDLSPKEFDTPVMQLMYGDQTDGKVVMTRADQSNWFINLQAQINYNRTFNRVHNVTGMLLAQRDEKEDVAGSIPFKMIGLSGRFTYNYDSRYLAEFNFGYNGSEQFAPKNRFGFFPAFSLGWVASSEKFMAPLYESGALTKLKFRASLGKVGNDVLGGDRFLYLNNISQFSFVPGLNGADYMNWQGLAYIPPTMASNGQVIREILLGNDRLQWETAWKQNYGVDITAFRNLDISFDYFIEHRSDILMRRNTIPYLSGLSSSQLPRSNFGKVDNRGFEVQATYTYAVSKDVRLSLTGNFSYAKNKVIEADEVTLGDDYAYPLRTTGFSLGQCWGYHIDYTVDPETGRDGSGFFNTQEQLDLFLSKTKYNLSHAPRVGDFIYKDLNKGANGEIGDGVIDTKDLAPIGYSSMLPRITYGATLSGQVYGFDFSVMIQGVGQYTRNFGSIIMYEWYGNNHYYADFCDNRWTPEKYAAGQKATHPALSYQGSSSHESNDYYTMDASYIRLKNIQLGYTIPAKITKKIGMNNVRVFISADNVHTWTNLRTKIIDPEQNSFSSYPLMKTYTAGLTVDL